MNQNPAPRTPQSPAAFTLIEMLIVIAIIAVLAALIFPVTGAVHRTKIRQVAKNELEQISTAIESYKAKHGAYPPDCIAPGSTPAVPIYINQLYYELLGTTLDNAGVVYITKDGSAQINAATVPLTFGAGVSGFVNSAKGAVSDEGTTSTAFIRGLKPGQIGLLNNGARIVVCSIPWPRDNAYQPTGAAGVPGMNPWRYVSTNPTNNAGSFDLWVDVVIGSKTNRISNWSDKPKDVGTP